MKTAGRILLLILILTLAFPALFVGLLTTPYSSQTWQWLATRFDLPLQIDSVQYHFPYHLRLKGIASKQQALPFIEQVDVWLNPDIRRDNQWIVDSLLIDGLSLQQGPPDLPNLHGVYFHQIALRNIDFADDDLTINGLNLQIQTPSWADQEQFLPYGEIQLSAEQIYWRGEAFNHLLLDMDYNATESTVYGASFNWRGSEVSGQAEQYPQGWSLINVTLDKLKLNTTQLNTLLAKPWQKLPITIHHINSLDLLNADIEYGDWHWQNLELSLENASLPLSLWEMSAEVSLQADSVRVKLQTAIEPRLNAQLTPGAISLRDLSLQWQQGTVQLSGQFEPNRWQIDTASISGLKWTIEAHDKLPFWQAAISGLQHVNIERLDIEHSQIIQLSQHPYWQLSGLNVEGKQLAIQYINQRWGIWQGQLDASVANASYDQVLASHAVLAMISDKGVWQLTRLFMPLKQGYLEGFGLMDLSAASQPWALNLSGDGLPLTLFHPYLPKTLALEGLTDLSLDLHGLAGDRNMLAYSLSGEIEAHLRDTQLATQTDHHLTAVTLTPVRLTAERGALALQPITLSGDVITGSISGEFDLAEKSLHGLLFQLNDLCGTIAGDILSGKTHTDECADKLKRIETQETSSKTKTFTATNSKKTPFQRNEVSSNDLDKTQEPSVDIEPLAAE